MPSTPTSCWRAGDAHPLGPAPGSPRRRDARDRCRRARPARELREAVYATFAAIARGEAPAAADLEMLATTHAQAAARAELGGAGGAWRLTWPAGEPSAIRFVVAQDALDLLGDEARIRRVSRCPGRDCGWLFVNASGRRRWCAMGTCGSREKMRRLYERRRMASPAGPRMASDGSSSAATPLLPVRAGLLRADAAQGARAGGRRAGARPRGRRRARRQGRRAREQVVRVAGSAEFAGAQVSVRVNAPRTPWCHADLIALAGRAGRRRPSCVPKVETRGRPRVRRPAAGRGRARGRPRRAAARAGADRDGGRARQRAARSPRASPRLDALILGYADLGVVARAHARGRERPRRLALRAGRAAGRRARPRPAGDRRPVPGDRRRRAASPRPRRARATLGFDGKWAIHPRQVAPLNELFTPTEDELERARAVIAALERRRRGRRRARRGDARRGGPRRRAADAGPGGRMTGGTEVAVSTGGPFFDELTRRPAARGGARADAHRRARRAAPGDRRRPAAPGARRDAVRPRAGRPGPLAHPGAGLRRRDRPVDARHAARDRQPLLPRPRAAAGAADRRHAAHDHRGRRAAPDQPQARPAGHRPRRAAHPHDRPAGAPGARLLALRDAAAARSRGPAPATRTTSTRSRPSWTPTPCAPPRPAGTWRPSASACPAPHADALAEGDALDARGRRRGQRGARARAAEPQRRDGPPRRRRRAAGSSTAATRSGSPPRRPRARCPNLVTIVAWHGCDHLGPVFEGDTLHSELELERLEPLPGGGALAHLRSRVRAARDGEPADVLDWRFVGVIA